MHAKYEVSISFGSKVKAKVKVDNTQTDRQTNRQDKNNMPPIIPSGGIKYIAVDGSSSFSGPSFYTHEKWSTNDIEWAIAMVDH